jgi:hypothetical protein
MVLASITALAPAMRFSVRLIHSGICKALHLQAQISLDQWGYNLVQQRDAVPVLPMPVFP